MYYFFFPTPPNLLLFVVVVVLMEGTTLDQNELFHVMTLPTQWARLARFDTYFATEKPKFTKDKGFAQNYIYFSNRDHIQVHIL